MILTDLPDDILENIYSNLNKVSLVNLKLTCKYLHNVSDYFLLQNIYFYDENKQMKPIDYNDNFIDLTNKFTLIPLSKLSIFIEFLKNNNHLINSIKFIQFSKAFDYKINKLISFIMKNCSKNLICFNYEVQYLNLLSNHSINYINTSNNSNNNNILYENDEIYNNNNNNYIYNDYNYDYNNNVKLIPENYYKLNHSDNKIPIHLSSLHIYQHEDSFKAINLNLEITKVCIELNQSVRNSFLNFNLIEKWSNNLKILKIYNSISYDYLNKSLQNYSIYNNNNNLKYFFNHLETLSITITDETIFKDLSLLNTIDISCLKNLEIRFKRITFNNNNNNNSIDKIVNLLNNKINFNSLTQLSIINLNNYDILNNDNIYKDEILKNNNLCYHLLNHFNIFNENSKNLTTLTLCLNNFLNVVGNINNLNLTDDYFNKKFEFYNNLKLFSNLKNLIIPDFLFNWLPFLKQFGDINEIYRNNLTNENPENFEKIEEIIRLLFKRFGNSTSRSCLDIADFPLLKYGHNINLKPYIDLLKPIIYDLSTSIPSLTLLNLGGFVVSIHRDTYGNITSINGMFDNWKC